MKHEIKVFVVSHKPIIIDLPENYSIISVGKLNDSSDIIFHDNCGDNISEKNKNYCELTALYWIWKNYHADIVGMVHYRRYLNYKGHIITGEEINTLLAKYDILLPTKWCGMKNNYDQYDMCHPGHDMDVVRDIVEKKYPEYVKYYDQYMRSHDTYLLNMFICKKKIIDEYCEWLFPILFEVESRVDISERDSYQQRIFGFLSERLFNVWILYKNLRTKDLELYETDEKISKVFIRRMNVVIKKMLTGCLIKRCK